MKLSVQQFAVLLATTLMTVVAQAHPGHDHSALSSSAIHAILFMSILAAVAGIGYFLVKKNSTKSEK